MRKLPPLNALRVFESVARLGGVKAASEELNITQSAVSHQVAKIETYLQAKLFHRTGRKLILTDSGQDYLSQIEPALDVIARATADTARISDKETLTISAPASLIANWLIPRLKSFYDQHAHLNLRLIERLTYDVDQKDIDCAIEYRLQAANDLHSEQILSDHVVPLISPTLLRSQKIKSIDQVRGMTLIETERRLISWQSLLTKKDWFKEQKILSVTYSLHAFEAAIAGLGIALGNKYNAERYIEKGDLVVPFEFEAGLVPATPRYFISTTTSKMNLPKNKKFIKWIHSQL